MITKLRTCLEIGAVQNETVPHVFRYSSKVIRYIQKQQDYSG